MDNENEAFSYTYSAEQQEEVSNILKKYLPQEESPLKQLRRLDKQAEQPGLLISITIGIIGTLLLGIGMCCTIEWTNYFVHGIAIGIIGIVLIAAAYPVYKKITDIQREKIAPQILELSKKL